LFGRYSVCGAAGKPDVGSSELAEAKGESVERKAAVAAKIFMMEFSQGTIVLTSDVYELVVFEFQRTAAWCLPSEIYGLPTR
jgi:hypothetical protein